MSGLRRCLPWGVGCLLTSFPLNGYTVAFHLLCERSLMLGITVSTEVSNGHFIGVTNGAKWPFYLIGVSNGHFIGVVNGQM